MLYFKKHTTEDKCETLAVISSKKTGDSKLWKDKIISSTSGHLILFDFNGSIVREYLDLEADWIYPLENSDFIIGGNFNNEVFSFSLDSDGNVLEYHNILTSDNVMIDPTVVQMDDTYLFTCTEIEGVVNNSNLNIENGTYTIHTYTLNIPVRQHRKSGRRETVCPGLRKPLMRAYSRNVLSKP